MRVCMHACMSVCPTAGRAHPTVGDLKVDGSAGGPDLPPGQTHPAPVVHAALAAGLPPAVLAALGYDRPANVQGAGGSAPEQGVVGFVGGEMGAGAGWPTTAGLSEEELAEQLALAVEWPVR